MLTSVIFTGCASNKINSEYVNIDFSEELLEEDLTPLESVNRRDTLIISFQGTDCGEWGGHRETLYIQRNEKNEIIARFLKDTVSCDIVHKDGLGILDDNKRVVIVDMMKTLNGEEEKLITNFIQRITELYLKGPLFITNSGNYYSIKNTNNTMKIFFWNSGNALKTGYYQMINNIFENL